MKENIWGEQGCQLPNGGLCTACCVLPEIELEGQYVSVAKPANSPCPYLKSGCSLQSRGKPGNCADWHCSMAGSWHKLELVAQSLARGEVSVTQAESAAKAINVSQSVVKIADRLKIITKAKPLEARELDET